MKRKYWYLIFAIILTLAIWLQLSLLDEKTTVIDMPIRIINTPDNLYIYNQTINIPVTVSGKGIDLISTYLSMHVIELDGSGFVLGANIIARENIERLLPASPDISINLISTESTFVFTTDLYTQKRVPVVMSFRSESDREFFINNNLSLDGSYITVSGPSELINEIEYVYTENLSINIIRNRRQSIRLNPINEHIILTPAIIELHTIAEMINTRTMTLIPIRYNETRFSIFPQRVTVIVEGETELLNSLTTDDIVAYFNDEQIEDMSDVEVLFIKPDFIRIIDITPQRIGVRCINN